MSARAAVLLFVCVACTSVQRTAGPAASRPVRVEGPDVVYFVLVDRFANGDRANDGEVQPADPAAFHGGDLQGVIDHLDELYALGVRTVWLSPVFALRDEKFFGHGAFHGYWVEDLRKVEPRFGTEATLRRLGDELHRRGMRLVLDMVLNHVAPNAPLARVHPEWFHRQGALEDWNDPVQLVERDVHGLPDLAQEREDVYRFLVEASLSWRDRVGADGFRLDAVKHIPDAFWARYNDEMRARLGSGFYLLGELLNGDPAKVALSQRQGRFGAMFDFPLRYAMVDVFCKGQTPVRLGAVLSADRFYDAPDSLVTFLDNHDLPRVRTECGGDAEKVRQALTFQLTARGTPSLTYGTEVGLEGAEEPHNRGDMVHDQEHPLRRHISRVLELRRRHPSLASGVPLTVSVGADRFVHARVLPDEAALVVVNRGARPLGTALPVELAAAGAEPQLLLGFSPGGGMVVLPGEVGVAVVKARQPGAFAALHAGAVRQRQRLARTRTVEVEVELEASGKGDDAGLAVVGSGPELGGWDPARAVAVDSAGRARTALPVGGVFEYKLVRRANGGKVEWEGGENRPLFVPEGDGPLRVPVVWRGER